jgi:L-ascorbate metabolism protein UlaG (beta-lactamase superfamily)
MRITKYVHACLLVEDEDYVVLFDPGEFSWASGLFDVNKLSRLDAVVITHEHFDHCSEEFIRALTNKFPDLYILSTEEVVVKLASSGIKATTEPNEHFVLTAAPHESMAPLATLPMSQNIGVHYKQKLTHPGDSYHIEETKEVFAMPLAGPWGAAIDGIRLAEKLKPKFVVPIHDWMWNDDWRQDKRIASYFDSIGIKFLSLTDGQPVEI